MENQQILETEIGNKEMTALKPAKVTIAGVKIEPVVKDGKEIGKKVTTICKHPDRKDTIEVSQVKYVKNDKIKTSGLWVNFDEDDKLQKGSALALFLNFMKVDKIKDLEGKEANTDLDSNGYLCFKIY